MMTLGPAKVVKRPLKTEWCFHHEGEGKDSETIEPLIEPRDKSEFLTRNNLDLPGFTQGLVQFRQ